jgi:hypothetical protein
MNAVDTLKFRTRSDRTARPKIDNLILISTNRRDRLPLEQSAL